MKFIFISALLSLLLVVVVSGKKESEKNDISYITKDKVQVRFGIKELNDSTYTINLQITPGISLFDAMLAEQEDGTFRFNQTFFKLGADEDQAYITSIFGIAEDPDNYLFWMLYDCKNILDLEHLNDLNGCIRSGTGVSQTYPENGDIFIFRYQYYNWKENQH